MTFVVHNRGTIPHGFEIEAEGEGDSSGPGSGDGLKAETELLQPGETTRLSLELLPGVYKVANDVSIRDFRFAPADLEVAPGTEVTWTNDDPAPHTVTAEDGSFDSGTLEPGQTFSVSVQGNGPVTYRCEIHPDMVGTITVR